jgi:hypothetical protein
MFLALCGANVATSDIACDNAFRFCLGAGRTHASDRGFHWTSHSLSPWRKGWMGTALSQPSCLSSMGRDLVQAEAAFQARDRLEKMRAPLARERGDGGARRNRRPHVDAVLLYRTHSSDDRRHVIVAAGSLPARTASNTTAGSAVTGRPTKAAGGSRATR